MLLDKVLAQFATQLFRVWFRIASDPVHHVLNFSILAQFHTLYGFTMPLQTLLTHLLLLT
jgi:hypothetical protein